MGLWGCRGAGVWGLGCGGDVGMQRCGGVRDEDEGAGMCDNCYMRQ